MQLYKPSLPVLKILLVPKSGILLICKQKKLLKQPLKNTARSFQNQSIGVCMMLCTAFNMGMGHRALVIGNW